MIYLGIDPGKSGAVAVLNAAGMELNAQRVPILVSPAGRDEYDVEGICFMLRELNCAPTAIPRIAMVTIEKQQPMPLAKGGTIANYNRGVASGWAWMLTALGIPYQLVAPQRWQKVMLADIPGSDTKQRSILAAQRLFPGVNLRRTERSRKLSDGLSDALLLAEYGRRVHTGRA